MNRTFPIAFGAIMILLLFVFLVYLTGYSSNYDVMNTQLSEVKAISLYDRGVLGNGSIQLTKASDVNHFFELLKASKRVECSDVNFKNSTGLCEIEIQLKNKESLNMTITNAVVDGGIVHSGNFCYRNDNLLVLIKDFLKGK